MLAIFHPYNREEWYTLLDEMLEHDDEPQDVIVVGELSDAVTTELLEFLDEDDSLTYFEEEDVNHWQKNGGVFPDGTLIPSSYTRGLLHTILASKQAPRYTLTYEDGKVVPVQQVFNYVCEDYVSDYDVHDLLVEAEKYVYLENQNETFDTYIKNSRAITEPYSDDVDFDDYNPCEDCIDWIEEESEFANLEENVEASETLEEDSDIVEDSENVSEEQEEEFNEAVEEDAELNELAKIASSNDVLSIELEEESDDLDAILQAVREVEELPTPYNDVKITQNVGVMRGSQPEDLVESSTSVDEWFAKASTQEIIDKVHEYEPNLIVRPADNFDYLFEGFNVEYVEYEEEGRISKNVRKAWNSLKRLGKK